MIRFKRKRNITNPFPIIVGLLVFCCVTSVVLSFLLLGQIKSQSNQNYQKSTFDNKIVENNNDIIDEEEIEIDNYSDISVLNRMKKMVNFGFSSFLNNCPQSDEIRPNNNQCIQNFGFQSTIFESLEALYLLNLTKLYKIGKKKVFDYFRNRNQIIFKNNYLVRSELFNRAVASLIGIYYLSKDKSFLSISEQLVDQIMLIDSNSFFPYPILNFHLQQGFERDWENGTSIVDIVSGLPEILSLYKITNKDKYLHYVKNLLEKIKKSNHQLSNDKFQLFVFYDCQNGQNKTNDLISSQNYVSFKEMYESLLRSYYLYNLQEISQIVPDIILSGSITNDVFFDSIHFYNYFNHSRIIYNMDSDIKTIFNEKFEFDAKIIRNKLRHISYSYLNDQISDNELKFEESIEEFIDTLLNRTDEKCKSLYGYSGLSYSNNKKQRKNNIQHSSFFGNWINSLGQALKYNISFWNYALFNTRGHLLYVQ